MASEGSHPGTSSAETIVPASYEAGDTRVPGPTRLCIGNLPSSVCLPQPSPVTVTIRASRRVGTSPTTRSEPFRSISFTP
jgi:hypothetical protein